MVKLSEGYRYQSPAQLVLLAFKSKSTSSLMPISIWINICIFLLFTSISNHVLEVAFLSKPRRAPVLLRLSSSATQH